MSGSGPGGRSAPEVAGVAAVLIALFIGVALFSWSPEDPPHAYVWRGGDGVQNLCGRIGAYTAAYLYETLGLLGSWATVAGLLLIGVSLVMRVETRKVLVRMAATGVLVFAAAGFEHLVFSGRLNYHVAGGAVGTYYGSLLMRQAGAAGATLALAFCVFISAALVAGAPCNRLVAFLKAIRSRRSEAAAECSTAIVGVAAREATGPEERPKRRKKTAPARPKKESAKKRGRAAADEPPSGSAAHCEFQLPRLSLLTPPARNQIDLRHKASLEEAGRRVQEEFSNFGVALEVVDWDVSAAVVAYRARLDRGVKFSKVKSMERNIAVALGVNTVTVEGSVGAPNVVSVVLPRTERSLVRMRELMSEDARLRYRNIFALPLFLAKTTSNDPLVIDLTKQPHLLVGGSTGSGKSVCLHTIICSLLLTRTAEEVRLVLVDAKMVELPRYDGIPHLLAPVIDSGKQAQVALDWARWEMDRRYRLLKRMAVTSLAEYNEMPAAERARRLQALPEEERVELPERMPHIVFVVDELAELYQLTNPKITENLLLSLSQKARAAGIHLVLATQRPSTDVVRGLIKANLPARLAFRVDSGISSRVLLDSNGAENLLGSGDMLYRPVDSTELVRAQCVFMSKEETQSLVEHLKEQGPPRHAESLMNWRMGMAAGDGAEASPSAFGPAGERGASPSADAPGDARDADGPGSRLDPKFAAAVEAILQGKRASVSFLQRRLGIGYEKSARIMDQLYEAGIVGGEKPGARSRDILVTEADWPALRAKLGV